MKQKAIICVMTAILFLLIVNNVRIALGEKWSGEDARKIQRLAVAEYTNQLVVVGVSNDGANLCFYERTNGDWELILETEAMIGKNGWGKTKEGDGRTPTGVFRFTKAFGIKENPGAKMEYTQVDESYYWVDDSNSNYYNQFVSINEITQDWKSAEHICEYKRIYNYVLAISYNSEGIKGAGSAVFLHCDSEVSEGTAGCIAVPEVYMRELIKRVGPDCVLIIDRNENILNY